MIYEGDTVVLTNGIDGAATGRNLDDGEEKPEECVRKVSRAASEMTSDTTDSFFAFTELDTAER